MNNSAKGRRTKNKVKKWYRQKGWTVADVEKNSKYGGVDAFGIADIIIIKPGGRVGFVQCKTNRPETKKTMKKFADTYGDDDGKVFFDCATWYDYKGLRIQRYVYKDLYDVCDNR